MEISHQPEPISQRSQVTKKICRPPRLPKISEQLKPKSQLTSAKSISNYDRPTTSLAYSSTPRSKSVKKKPMIKKHLTTQVQETSKHHSSASSDSSNTSQADISPELKSSRLNSSSSSERFFLELKME